MSRDLAQVTQPGWSLDLRFPTQNPTWSRLTLCRQILDPEEETREVVLFFLSRPGKHSYQGQLLF